MIKLIFTFINLLIVFHQCSAYSITVEIVALQALRAQDAAGTLVANNFQRWADIILHRIGILFPTQRFIVFVTAPDTELNYKRNQTNIVEYKGKKAFILSTLEGDSYTSGNPLLETTDCYGNITDEFTEFKDMLIALSQHNHSCRPIASAISQRIGDACGLDGNGDFILGAIGVVRAELLGVASSLPKYAVKSEFFTCQRGKQVIKWRVVVVLYQKYEEAETIMFKKLVGNLTRIKALGNGKFVSAENSGDGPLKANQGRVDFWEQFVMLQNLDDNSTSLQAHANGKFVTADKNVGGQLIARGEYVQQWERFDSVPLPHGAFALRAHANGLYVRADLNRDGLLVADREHPDKWEKFEFSSALSGQFRTKLLDFPVESSDEIVISKSALWVLSGFLLVFIPIILISICVCCFFYRIRDIRAGFGFQMQAYGFLHLRTTDRKLDSTTIDSECLLFSGPNSRVYLAKYRFASDGVRQVAVKVPSKEAFRMDMIMKEANINAQLRHSRIVEYIGYYSDAFGDLRIVNEFMEGGDLHSFLTSHKNHLTIGHLYSFIGQIAEGMEYLASKKITHRDLAARNCMLNGDRTAIKIADFGLSRHFNLDANYASSSPVRLPLRWTAIECLGQNGEVLPHSRFSEKSDVWSFGIVCWECFTRGQVPYGAVEIKEVLPELNEGKRLTCPECCPLPFYKQIVLRCWAKSPEARPSFGALKQLLEQTFAQLIADEPDSIVREVNWQNSSNCCKNVLEDWKI